jgi:hypothetical protein
MKRQLHASLSLCVSLAIAISGCAPTQPYFFFEDGDMSHYVGLATDIEHPDVDTVSLAEVEYAGQPITVSDPDFEEIWELEWRFDFAARQCARPTASNARWEPGDYLLYTGIGRV